MKSLIGYLKKTLLAFSLSLLTFPFLARNIYAQETPFNVSSSFVHKVSGKTVNTELTIHLSTEITRVLSLYTTSIQTANIKASCFTASGSSIKCESYNRTSTTDVQMDLRNTVIGPESPLDIKIIYSYELDNEITYSFPSKVLDAKTTDVKIIYQKSKGDFSWTSENFASKKDTAHSKEVLFKNPAKDSISIFFDEHILYSFTINRQFNNSNEGEGQTFELIVPLDDSTQSIVWEKIDPLPTSAIKDNDGNYIFKYLIKSGESISAKLSGYILKERVEIQDPPLEQYLSTPTGLWEIRGTTEIKRLTSFMKDKGLDIKPMIDTIDTLKKSERELFYKLLYQYVIYRLDSPKNSSLGLDNSARLGVNHIIENALTSTQADYADFYIALLRNFSIPSRMVIGYISNVSSYTTDGFYHYWVEYFDKNKMEWVQVDPFIEEYFGNSMFGTKLNDHIAILKRGKSPMAPTLTFYTPTDFIVQMDTKETVEKSLSTNSGLSLDNYDITKQYAKAYIIISNTGNVIISKIDFVNSNIGNINKYIDSVNNNFSSIILPKQTSNIQLNIPTEHMFFNTVSISLKYGNGAGVSGEATVKDKIHAGIPLYTKVLSKILSIVSFGILLILFYTIYKLIKNRKWTQQ